LRFLRKNVTNSVTLKEFLTEKNRECKRNIVI